MVRYKNLALTIVTAGAFVLGQAAFAQNEQSTSQNSQTSTSSSTNSEQNETNNSNSTLTKSEQQFMKNAAQTNLAEIKVGQLAEQKSDDAQVKDMGRKLVSDHTQALDKLKTIAQEKGVTLPDQPSAKQQAQYDKLSKLSGDKFDKTFLRMQEQDHRKAISEFKREAKKAQDPAIREYAQNTLPKLEDHLQMARTNYARETGSNRGTVSTDNTGGYPQNPNNNSNNNPDMGNPSGRQGYPSTNPNVPQGNPQHPR